MWSPEVWGCLAAARPPTWKRIWRWVGFLEQAHPLQNFKRFCGLEIFVCFGQAFKLHKKLQLDVVQNNTYRNLFWESVFPVSRYYSSSLQAWSLRLLRHPLWEQLKCSFNAQVTNGVSARVRWRSFRVVRTWRISSFDKYWSQTGWTRSAANIWKTLPPTPPAAFTQLPAHFCWFCRGF